MLIFSDTVLAFALWLAVTWDEEQTGCLSEHHHLIVLWKLLLSLYLMSLPKGLAEIFIEKESKDLHLTELQYLKN